MGGARHAYFRLQPPLQHWSSKKYVEGSKCCWHCFNCTKYQILRYETTCYDCPLGFLPNADHTQCERIPLQYMRLDSYWAIGVMIFSSGNSHHSVCCHRLPQASGHSRR
ncbi:metabotropic glutamate receptor [Trichonephila clavata]|uniref:Metabotropic glutamate receptor n=1 Tax=Trichonephila clavata TaxID=2740835 RepID=A0A8X6FXD2_TRICU|nr:metabotropic glutamate receptor [Trichonephila clavata]